MRRFMQIATALAVLTTSFASFSPTDASAQSFLERQRFVERFCDRNPRARDCREFRRDARRWDDRRYRRWYRENRREDRNFAAAAAIFGLAAGAAIAGSQNDRVIVERPVRVSRSSIARCAARYRSYDANTHTYVNGSGDRVYCRL